MQEIEIMPFRYNVSLASIFALAVLLSACSGGGSGGQTTPPSMVNTAPTITGSAQPEVVAGEFYAFTPDASDPEQDRLEFSIENLPAWARFDTSSGYLSGTPAQEDLGVHNNIRISVSDSELSATLDEFSIAVRAAPNRPPEQSNQHYETHQSVQLLITLGPLRDADDESISYSVSGSENFSTTANANQITYASPNTGVDILRVEATDGISAPVISNVSISVTPTVPSNYVTTRDIIFPDYTAGVPAKGESRVDPVTGIRITRLTDASELNGTDDALIVYSRFTPESSDGRYVLAFGSDSSSSWVIERSNGSVVNELVSFNGQAIGESHEIRWDTSGNFPNRVYYRSNMALYMIGDVTASTLQHTLIKDFSAEIPNATQIYNDVEGDSSIDSDHWAFMAAHYDGVTFVVDAFVHYQISTDTTHTMRASDFAGTPLAHHATTGYLPRPNMVEISPLGTGIVLHYGRAFQGERAEDIGTHFDGAHLWPLDFDIRQSAPVKIAVGETHSGWAFAADGRELFVSQNNRSDRFDAVYITGQNAGFANRTEFAYHGDLGWSNGFHFGKLPAAKSGWAFVSTYSDIASSSHDTDWGADQFIMLQIRPEASNPAIWRITPNYNRFAGEYRDEGIAAMNTFGNRIYVTGNWGGAMANREVFMFDLPSNWDTVLNE